MTERIAFRMRLHPGREAEYRRRHDAIWPELSILLKAAGISDYSIWLDRETGALFATLLRTEGHGMDSLPLEPVMRRWWEHMADIMATEPDGAPTVAALEPMFQLD
ncbi:MAG: L-rhamnose mutarotase [Amaricoccus sp.]|uniref:L-rhamnose mutarotase n=1 Tax=Amaricoccus sp. TaxID=1872485 RepID=UPI003314DC89